MDEGLKGILSGAALLLTAGFVIVAMRIATACKNLETTVEAKRYSQKTIEVLEVISED